MITIFNRAVLLRDPNADAAARVRSALTEAGIQYKMKTDGSGGSSPGVRVPNTGRMGSMTAGIGGGMSGGIPQSWSEGGGAATFYVIYVRKSDLKRAKEVCGVK